MRSNKTFLMVEGNDKRKHRVEDLRGQRFGPLSPIHPEYKKGEMGWVSRCICGKEAWILVSTLRRTRSPHCTHGDSRDVTHYYNQYVQNSKSSGIKFSIARHEFAELLRGACYYCGKSPEDTRYGTEKTYNLLGRKDPHKGYTPENSIPVCGTCKQLTIEMDEMDMNEYIKSLMFQMEKRHGS